MADLGVTVEVEYCFQRQRIPKQTKNEHESREQASDLSLSCKTDVTVNLTTFIELLTTMAIDTKDLQKRWMDPSCDWGQSGG